MGKLDWEKGSLTIELVCLMPAVLLVIFGVLALCFYVHNRCFLSAAAWESALTGAMEEYREDGEPTEAARLRVRERGNIGFYGLEDLSVQVHGDKNQIQVSCRGKVPVLYGGLYLDLKSQGAAQILHPADKIRKKRIWKGDED